MRKRHDYASVLIWAAVLVTVVRYAGAFIASDLGEITGWVSEALSLAMGLTGLGMGLLDVLGGAYIFDGWRRSMPRTGQKWPFRFRILTVFAIGLFAIGIWILVPFTVSRVSHSTMEQVLGNGWGLWTWSVAVNIAPYLLIGGVVTGNVGVVGVSIPEIGGAAGGKLPESSGGGGKVGGTNAEQTKPVYRDWREVPESEWTRIAGMSTAGVMRTYGVKEKTARNWRHYAVQALQGRVTSPQAELFSLDPGSTEGTGTGEGG